MSPGFRGRNGGSETTFVIISILGGGGRPGLGAEFHEDRPKAIC
jgi:hypothetical protein